MVVLELFNLAKIQNLTAFRNAATFVCIATCSLLNSSSRCIS
jgi:hypothetical protein